MGGSFKIGQAFAIVAGVVLVLLGLSGTLLNLPDSPLVVDSLRLLTGFALVYAGLGRCRVWYCRAIVGGVGLLFLMMGMIGPAEAILGSTPISSYEGTAEALLWVVFGLLSLWVVALAGENESPSLSERDS